MKWKIRQELRDGKSIKDVCNEYGLSFEELTMLLNKNARVYVPKNNATNISKKDDKFVIQKTVNKQRIYFGIYDSMEDAVAVREELKQCNWDKSRLKEIQIRNGIGISNLGNTYIQENRNGNWTIHKIFGRKRVNYGTYKTLREAKLVRDELVKFQWDKSKLDKIVSDLKVRRIYAGGQPKRLMK